MYDIESIPDIETSTKYVTHLFTNNNMFLFLLMLLDEYSYCSLFISMRLVLSRFRLYKKFSDWLEMLPMESTGLNT